MTGSCSPMGILLPVEFCPGLCESPWVAPSAFAKQCRPLGGDFPVPDLCLSEFLGFYTERSPKKTPGTLLSLNKTELGLWLWPQAEECAHFAPNAFKMLLGNHPKLCLGTF